MKRFLSSLLKSPTAKIATIAILIVMAFITAKWNGGLKIRTEVNLKSLERIGDLCLLKVFDTYVITNKLNGISGTFVTPCDAILKLNFADIAITKSKDVYSVVLPPITVSQARVDRADNSFKSFDVSKDFMSALKRSSSDSLRRAAMKEAQQRIEREALSARFVDVAKERATNIVSTMICKEAGFDNVSFEWHWADKQEKTDSTFVSSESD